MFKRLLCCAIFFFASVALVPANSTELNLKEVASGVFVHQGIHALPDRQNQGEIANIGFIVGERCVAVVDSGGSPAQGRALKAAIKGMTKVPICHVINTHAHPDHIYGNSAFKEPGVAFVGHRKLAQAMAARAPYFLEKAGRDLGLVLKQEDFIAPSQIVESTLELDLGGRKLTLTAHGPAHTDNDLSVFDDKTRTLWLADLLFMGHLPVVDGSLSGWLKELAKLTKIEAKLAIPGHGPVASEWPKAADAEIRYLEMLRNEIRVYIKQGKTMEQAMAEVGQSARGDWQLFDDFHKRNIATAFAELEWED
ncbi:MAG: quinoprotein relay system zinc metallohydrolase 2 [Candidatus Methylumidiphilus sp.]